MLKVAMIGFGGIAKTVHLPAYRQLEKEGVAQLVAVADITPSTFEGKAEINIGSVAIKLDESVHTYSDWKQMLAEEKVDMVDICVPTYLHAEIAVQVLKMGHHVLCEKPMSLSYDLCCDMINAAKEAGKKLMIGQCLRFAGGYNYVKKVIEDGSFGALKTAVFRRLSPTPMWSWNNWYMDFEKSHGCITDLHIHDIDMCRYLFGEPYRVSCHTQDLRSKKDLAHTTLCYPDFSVFVEGDWTREGMSFTADFHLNFEKATVSAEGGKLMVYPRDGAEAYEAEYDTSDCYYNEIAFFVDTIINNKENVGNPPESAALTIKLINTLMESSDKNGDYIPFEA